MNQSILFNDDLISTAPGVWHISGFYNGELLEFKILSSVEEATSDIAFDWEAKIEDWLESNEPEQTPIILDFTSS